jgi:hypothetical protein
VSRKDDLFGISAAHQMRSLVDKVALGGASAQLATIRRIRAVHPELGAHLSQTVATGIQCSYRGSVRWIVSRDPI